MTGALHGIKILDPTWGVAGPLGVLMLAEQGAAVVKIEPPGGDPFRTVPAATSRSAHSTDTAAVLLHARGNRRFH